MTGQIRMSYVSGNHKIAMKFDMEDNVLLYVVKLH